MTESKTEKLPRFTSNQDLVEFFDTHDMGEYEDELPEVDFEVDIQRKHYLVSIEGDVTGKLLETDIE